MVNEHKFTGEFAASAAKIVGEEDVVVQPTPTMVSEGMAYYLEKGPGTFWELGGNLSQGESFPHHSSRFDINEDVFWKGGAVMAQAAFDWLERNGAL